jgi:hypothetical protein
MEIELTQGKIAVVDKKYFFLNNRNWYVIKQGTKVNPVWYAACSDPRINGKRPPTVRMHRVIMELELGRLLIKGEEIDHINHDGLDNRVRNLRVCNRKENIRNQRVYRIQKTSRYKGVSWYESSSKWGANIRINDKQVHLGLFSNERDAAKSYAIAAKQAYGEFAYSNFKYR